MEVVVDTKLPTRRKIEDDVEGKGDFKVTISCSDREETLTSEDALAEDKNTNKSNNYRRSGGKGRDNFEPQHDLQAGNQYDDDKKNTAGNKNLDERVDACDNSFNSS